ncbi:MAG: CAP domain-containing protein [Dehalococcoidia bacterium]
MLITVSLLAGPTSRVPSPVFAADAESVGIELAEEALALLNAERSANGLAPLEEAPDLDIVAASRALDMAATDTLSHSIAGSGAEALLHATGVPYDRMGENIARSDEAADQVVEVIHVALMASDSHRSNMLDPHFDHVGIGVARLDNTYYFAVVFVGDG